MREELDAKLCKKYPEIFRDRHGDMKETLMCWGFECGDGWYQILDSLCGQIQHHINWSHKNHAWDKEWNHEHPEEKRKVRKPVPQVVAVQVKEKFGGLRFYYQGGDDYVRGLVAMAESWAAVSCEQCGHPGTQNSQGWISTLCETHRKKQNEALSNQ